MNNFEYISRGRVYKVNHFRTIHLKCSTENYLCFEVNMINLPRHVFASRGLRRTDNSSMAEMCSVC